MSKMKYRHGDVILILTKTTSPVKGQKRTNNILAYGEVTGHKHQISAGQAITYGTDEEMILEVKSDTASLTHEEHGLIEIPRGVYKVMIQREYQPEGWRYVQD